ncbi:type II secretion system protein GspM [Massilia sp. CF038]|jgi:general secretion pathway protein M|uniref:type II secretion system protein GspM n=1 Tax=Massilia sp. CF038 TaxID=1881045 RepID=UPI000917D09A|nr:type II secretion system protein GspM [Massilia sp. CF038]SHH39955.1 type II secretion system protein M (GspM) [Massilia sp. CF038]
MSAMTVIGQFKDQLALYWLARTEQERKYLTVGGATVVGALIYMLFIGPAIEGKAKLNVSLPQLRVEAATMQALALEAGELAARPAPQVTPMTRETLTAGLTARGITPTSLIITGEYAKIQLTNVSFANVYSWLDAQRRENRIGVDDASFTAGTPAGQVDAQLTLRQNTGEASR